MDNNGMWIVITILVSGVIHFALTIIKDYLFFTYYAEDHKQFIRAKILRQKGVNRPLKPFIPSGFEQKRTEMSHLPELDEDGYANMMLPNYIDNAISGSCSCNGQMSSLRK